MGCLPRPRRLAVPLVLVMLAACGAPRTPSVLLITLDTTRWDHLGTYGDPAARTPVFDALARRGTLYRQALVDSPTTLPAHATMLTGAISLRHGVRLNDTFTLAEEASTLAERFAAHGYATAAVVSSVTLAADRGLDQGFDLYDDEIPARFDGYDPALADRTRRFIGTQRRAHQTTAAARRALGAVKSPAFLWVHYVDAHETYDPPPPWNGVSGLSPYAGEIAYADRELGRFLDSATAALGPSVVAVLSDHGEGLGDHREDEHGMFLYDTTVRIPFALVAPGLPPGRIVSTPALNADVAPTLLAAAGLPADPFPDGVALPPAASSEITEPRSLLSETITPTRFHGGSRLKALRHGRMKYVLAPTPELYDLESDPGETRDLLAGDRDRAEALRERLRDLVGAIDPATSLAEPAAKEETHLEALRALGYVAAGRSVPAAPEHEAHGIDPKDLIDVTRSIRYVMDGRYDEARPRLERFWRTHPEVPDSSWHELFARAHLAQAFVDLTDLRRTEGHVRRARENLEAALHYDPGYRHALELQERLDELGKP